MRYFYGTVGKAGLWTMVLVGIGAMAAGYGVTSARAETNAAPPSEEWNPTGQPTGDPWSQIEQFHNRMNQLFSDSFDHAGKAAFEVPNMDIKDLKDHYEVTMDMPGADKDKINIQVEGRVLSVSGERDTANATQKNSQVLRDERGEARFERVTTLPGPVKVDAVKTTFANGVLTIILPKDESKTASAPPPAPIHAPMPTAPQAWPGFPPDMGMGFNSDPMDEIEQFHNRMDRLFADTFSQSDLNSLLKQGAEGMAPSLDLRDEKDHYEVRMDMPGADKASVRVKIEGRNLLVTGQRTTTNDTSNNGQVLHSERSTAQFERSITLPGPVKASAVDAHYDNGVLTLRLPKDDAAETPTDVPVH